MATFFWMASCDTGHAYGMRLSSLTSKRTRTEQSKNPTEEQGGRTGDDFVVLRDDEGAVRCSDAKVDVLRLQEVGAVALQLEFLASALPAAARWRDGREVAVALGDPVPGANA
jgi:hypothetical protein